MNFSRTNQYRLKQAGISEGLLKKRVGQHPDFAEDDMVEMLLAEGFAPVPTTAEAIQWRPKKEVLVRLLAYEFDASFILSEAVVWIYHHTEAGTLPVHLSASFVRWFEATHLGRVVDLKRYLLNMDKEDEFSYLSCSDQAVEGGLAELLLAEGEGQRKPRDQWHSLAVAKIRAAQSYLQETSQTVSFRQEITE